MPSMTPIKPSPVNTSSTDVASIQSMIAGCDTVSTFMLETYTALSSVAPEDDKYESAQWAAKKLWLLIGEMM